MKNLKVRLENCYGIKLSSHEFNFNEKNTFAIYGLPHDNRHLDNRIKQHF